MNVEAKHVMFHNRMAPVACTVELLCLLNLMLAFVSSILCFILFLC
jgi:hypothetical protein